MRTLALFIFSSIILSTGLAVAGNTLTCQLSSDQGLIVKSNISSPGSFFKVLEEKYNFSADVWKTASGKYSVSVGIVHRANEHLGAYKDVSGLSLPLKVSFASDLTGEVYDFSCYSNGRRLVTPQNINPLETLSKLLGN